MPKFLTPNPSTLLITSLKIEDCQKRLNNAIDQDGLASISKWNDKPAYGKVNERWFYLKRRRFFRFGSVDYPSGQDPYTPYLDGLFLESKNGTEIHCSLTRAQGISWLTGIWFAIAFVIFSCLTIGTICSLTNVNDNAHQPFSLIVVLLAMILMGIGRIYFANKAGMRDYDFLIDFLKSTCEAEKIDFQGQHKVRQANQEA